MNELKESFEKMMEAYHNFKVEVRHRDKYLYERWKAGGFLVDDDIISMYPSAEKVYEQLYEEPEEDEEEE